MKGGVEGPGADAVALTFREVEEEHGEVAVEVAPRGTPSGSRY